MKELSLFTGMGGGIYGSMILGWETVAYVEQDEYCQKVIAQRIQDGWFDNGGIYGDIAEFNRTDAHKYAGQIDILTAGMPCQPVSLSGKREGTSDERYLINETIETIEIVQPAGVLLESVYGLFSSNVIIEIYKALEKIGYRPKPALLLGSRDCDNIHERKRVWIYATHPDSERTIPSSEQPVQGQSYLSRRSSIRGREDLFDGSRSPFPYVRGMDDELPNRRKQLKAIGNGQDPIVMATAYKILSGEFA